MLPVDTRHSRKYNLGTGSVTLVIQLDAEARLAQKTAPQLQDLISAAKSNLSDKDIRELKEIITRYEDAFATKGSDYVRTD
jgi:hypothetical protein